MRMELQRMQQKADEVTDDVSILSCLQYNFITGSMYALYCSIYLYNSQSHREEQLSPSSHGQIHTKFFPSWHCLLLAPEVICLSLRVFIRIIDQNVNYYKLL